MKRKIEVIILSIIIIVLVSSIAIVWISNGQSSKQIRKALSFLEKLEDVEAINDKTIPELTDFIEVASGEVGESQGKYSIVAGDYRVNLDNEHNVIGFTNKKVESLYESKIDSFKAIELASKYLSNITDDRIEYSQIRSMPDEEKPYYLISFYTIYKDYKNYSNEILVQICENSGKLMGYSVVSKNSEKYNSEVNITEDEAEKNVLSYFKSKEVEGYILANDAKGYIHIDDKVSQLCYVVNYEVILEDKTKSISQVFVSTETGDILKEVVITEYTGIVE